MAQQKFPPQHPGRPTDPDGITGRLCDWLANFRLDKAPASARERAKAVTLDGIACAIVGAQLPWSRRAAQIVQKFEGKGDRSIVGWGAKTSAPGAALLNGTFIQGFELDDVHMRGPLHSGSIILPALWAIAEGEKTYTGRQFLEAALVGYEVGPRVGISLNGGEMLSRGWHSGSVIGTHAAAAAVGKLMGLDAGRFEDALGLAGTQSSGLMAAQYEAMSKRMHHGFASRNGMYAAVFAEGGYTGIKRVFEREYGGFLSTFGEGHSPKAHEIVKGLGEVWEVESILIKPYATMAGCHAPLDALFDVGAQRALKPEEIQSIDCQVTHSIFHHGWWVPERPMEPIGAQMNIGYGLSVAVLDGAALVKQFSPARVDSDDVWAFLPKVQVRHQPEFDKLPGIGHVCMRVTFTDGQVIEVRRTGSRANEEPQSNAEIAAKYRGLTDGLITRERQEKIEAAVMQLEEMSDVRELIALLAPPVQAAF